MRVKLTVAALILASSSSAFAYGVLCKKSHNAGHYEYIVVDDGKDNAFWVTQNFVNNEVRENETRAGRLTKKSKTDSLYGYHYEYSGLKKDLDVYRDGSMLIEHDNTIAKYASSRTYNCAVLDEKSTKAVLEIGIENFPQIQSQKPKQKF